MSQGSHIHPKGLPYQTKLFIFQKAFPTNLSSLPSKRSSLPCSSSTKRSSLPKVLHLPKGFPYHVLHLPKGFPYHVLHLLKRSSLPCQVVPYPSIWSNSGAFPVNLCPLLYQGCYPWTCQIAQVAPHKCFSSLLVYSFVSVIIVFLPLFLRY